MRIAVNTISTKSYSGGALQIAYNFLLETLNHQEDGIEWYYITSSDVDDSVGEFFKDLKDTRYFVFPTQPDFKGTYHSVKRELALWEERYHPDVIYTISSPCYFTFKTPEVMRFANAWMTNPNKLAWKSMPWKKRIRMHLYRINQFRMLRKANYIITQSETVRKGLLRITGLPEDHIKVVPNVLPKVFADATVGKIKDGEWIDVNCAAAPVPHKNLDIIPNVLKALKDNYSITKVRFHLTIPEGDTLLNKIRERCADLGFIDNIVNHGRCTQQQLINVYNQCGFCFLPTLLETFSASSLEAMRFEQCIVATEFEFNKEIIGEAGLYYKPMDAKDAADKIASLIKDSNLCEQLVGKMKERLPIYNDYHRHFSQTVNFLKKVISFF